MPNLGVLTQIICELLVFEVEQEILIILSKIGNNDRICQI